MLERRPDYWQADKIKVKKLVLEGQYDAAQAALKLRSGQLDAYWGEIPNPKKTFVDADPKNNHFYYAPNGIDGAHRQRREGAVQRREVPRGHLLRHEQAGDVAQGDLRRHEAGEPDRPQAAVDGRTLLPAKYAGEDTVLPYDLAKANQLLDAAGYKKGADGKRTNPDGSPLAVNFSVQAGFIDYQAIADVVVKGLNDAGVTAKVTASAPDSVDGQKKSGDFQLMLEYLHGGCELAKNLGAKLSSTQIPTKTDVLPNVERFKDPAVDAAVTKLAGDTDRESQKARPRRRSSTR